MTGVRVISIVCPYCGGQGYLTGGLHRCTVCGGSERIAAADARDYANDQRKMCDALGAGELSWPQKRRCAAVAERIYELLQEVPPWRRHRRVME